MKNIKEEKANLLLEMVGDLGFKVTRAAKILDINLSTAYQIVKYKKRLNKKSAYFLDRPCNLSICPVCGGKIRLEELPADQEDPYLIPMETGCFDLICDKGHRFSCEWPKRKEKEDGIQASTPAGNNAGVSLRREETEHVDNSMVSSAKTGRGEMSLPHRRSWRSYTLEQRGQRDNECSSYSGGTGVDEPEKGSGT